MSRKITSSPYRQTDPSPGDRRRTWRVIIFIIMVTLAAVLLVTGRDLQTVLLTVLGIGLAGATVARWVTDDGPLPGLLSVLPAGGGRGFTR